MNTDYLKFDTKSVEWAIDTIRKYDEKFPREDELYKKLSHEFGWLLKMLDYTAYPSYFFEQQYESSKAIVLKDIGNFSWAQIIDDNLLRVYADKKEVAEEILINFPKLPPYN